MAISLLVAGQSAASISWKPSCDMGEDLDLPTFPYFIFRHSFFLFWTLCDALRVVVKRARFDFSLEFAWIRRMRIANGSSAVCCSCSLVAGFQGGGVSVFRVQFDSQWMTRSSCCWRPNRPKWPSLPWPCKQRLKILAWSCLERSRPKQVSAACSQVKLWLATSSCWTDNPFSSHRHTLRPVWRWTEEFDFRV